MSQPAIPPSYGAREAQPLDRMLDFAGDNGWAFFQPQDPKEKRGTWQEAEEERAAAAARAAAAVMATPEGRALLEFLADISVRRPMFFFEMEPARAAAYAALREGQNGLFYTILALVAAGREEQPTVRKGT